MADSDNHTEENCDDDDDDDTLHETDEVLADTRPNTGSHDVMKMQTEYTNQLTECMFKYSVKNILFPLQHMQTL